MNKKKTLIILIAALLVAGGGTAVYFVQGSKTAKNSTAAQVQTAKVTKGNLQSTITGTAQLAAEQLQMITPPKEGMIKTINLTRNQSVKQGDLLLELTDTSLVERLDSAKVSLGQYGTDLKDLLDQQRSLRTTAPATGKFILASNVGEGSNVTKTTKLGSIADTSVLTVTLPFIQEETSSVRVGDTVQLTIDGFLLTKTGTIESISAGSKADAKGNRVSDVKIRLDNDGTLDADLNAQGSITVNGLKVDSTGSAKLQYKTTTTVFANVSGTIGKLDVTENRSIRAGEPVAVIANDTLTKDITNKQQQIEQQNKTIKDLEDQLANLKVFAPFDGVFSTDFADTKTNVLASYRVGSTIKSDVKLGAVASLDTLQLAISVDELDLPKVSVGQKAKVRVDAISGKTFDAQVTQVSTVGTTANGVSTYSVILSLKSSPELKYGMTASADIIIADKKDVLLLPTQAVQTRSGKSFVMIQKDGKTERKEVKVGVNDSNNVEITEGLAEGDQVTLASAGRANNLTPQQIEQMRNQFQQGARNTGGNGGQNQGGGFQGGGNFAPPGGGGGGNR